MSMGQRIVQVDAFTNRPYAGNPAAVCVLPAGRSSDPAWMQALAREMNLSETAFVAPAGEAFGLRWFTPSVEVDLCGHATLASAHVLWEEGILPAGRQARFDTKSGRLTADQRDGWIELDFPAVPTAPCSPPADLQAALGVEGEYVGKNRMDYFVAVRSEALVRGLQPDHSRLRRLPVRGVVVTAPADRGSEFDFVSRFFAPGSGVDEDPVTGSAHCALAPYWTARLGKTAMTGYQASPRGGVVRTRVAGDRVILGGQAVTVLRGELA